MRKIIKFALIGILFSIYLVAVLFKSDLLGNILSPVVTLIAAYYMFLGSFVKESDSTLKKAGIFWTLSIFSWGTFDIMWAVTEIIFKKNPDNIFVISYGYNLTNVFLLTALIIAGYHELKKWNRVQVLVDTVAISICTGVLAWVIFLNQNMKNIIILKDDWISMSSVIINILMFSWMCIWIFSIRKGRLPLSLVLSLSGVLVFFISDTIYYYEYFYTKYDPNSLLDGLYVISFGLMGLGNYVKVLKQEKPPEDQLSSTAGVEKGVFLLATPLALLIFKGFQWQYLLITLSVIMFYFVFTNYIQKNVYRDEIFQKELKLNLDLEKKVAERTEELNSMLNRDMITGLYSRRYFLERLDKKMLELEENENILLFYIDVNRYKMIKTMFGNYIGEKTLIELGRRLSCYEHDLESILASYGEDVFVFAIRGYYTYAKGVEVAKKLITLSSDIYRIDNFDIRVTVNIGISRYPTDSKTRDELIKHADIAMSQARTLGFNKIMTFDKKLVEMVSNKNRIEIMLKKVHYDHDFFLYFQPQILLKDESLIGFEALIRWKTQTGEFISPADFIPIAEETGVIIPLGYWVMEKAISQLASWKSISRQEPRIAINVSVKQLNDANFLNRLQEIMRINSINPERVEIEIIESIQLEESPEIKDIMKRIKNMGVSIAVDDFGTGYSSLYYLKNLPIDRIKIAKPLIDRIDQDAYDYTIVKTVIDIARVKGIKVIAEGVETKEQLDCLRELDCDEIQGYYFARPMPPEEAVEKWL